MKYINILIILISGFCYSQKFIVINKNFTKEYTITKTITKTEITDVTFYGDQASLAQLKKDGVEIQTHLTKEYHDIIDLKGVKNGNNLNLMLDYKTSSISETRNGKKANFDSPFINLKAFGKYDQGYKFIVDSIHKNKIENYNYNLLKLEIENKLELINFPKDTIYIGDKLKFYEEKIAVSNNHFLIRNTFLTLKKVKGNRGFFKVNSEMFLSQKSDRIDFEFKSDGGITFDFEKNIIIYQKRQSELEIKLSLNDGYSTNIKNSVIILESNTPSL